MSKSKVRITPNPAATTKVNETGQTTSKQRATVSGVKSKPQQVQMEMLFNKNNFIDLDVMSHADAAQTVANLITNRDLLDDMSENAYRSFTNAVDFQHDANKVGEWMFNL